MRSILALWPDRRFSATTAACLPRRPLHQPLLVEQLAQGSLGGLPHHIQALRDSAARGAVSTEWLHAWRRRKATYSRRTGASSKRNVVAQAVCRQSQQPRRRLDSPAGAPQMCCRRGVPHPVPLARCGQGDRGRGSNSLRAARRMCCTKELSPTVALKPAHRRPS